MGEARNLVDYFVVTQGLAWLPEEPIASFRRTHDPTVDLIAPHLTLVFPVPATIGLDAFRDHVLRVVSQTPAFDIRLRGLEKSWDHWLFLLVEEGSEEVIALHDSLYAGMLEPYLVAERPYVPHVGLGLFADERDADDLLELRPRRFDRVRFGKALAEAEALALDYVGRFDSVRISGLDEGLTFITHLENLSLA